MRNVTLKLKADKNGERKKLRTLGESCDERAVEQERSRESGID